MTTGSVWGTFGAKAQIGMKFRGDARRVQKAEYGEGCSVPSRLGSLGERLQLPRRTAGNAFWHILKATKCSFLYLYVDAFSNLVLEILKHDKI